MRGEVVSRLIKILNVYFVLNKIVSFLNYKNELHIWTVEHQRPTILEFDFEESEEQAEQALERLKEALENGS